MIFGENLKRFRKSKNKTQQQFADILDIKRTTYATYETGRIGMSTELLHKLAGYFDTTIDKLLKDIKQQISVDDKSINTQTSEEEASYKLGTNNGNDEKFLEIIKDQSDTIKTLSETLKSQQETIHFLTRSPGNAAGRTATAV